MKITNIYIVKHPKTDEETFLYEGTNQQGRLLYYLRTFAGSGNTLKPITQSEALRLIDNGL